MPAASGLIASHGKNVVRDGLVLYLDAALSQSYPGTGTTWTDLSNSSINATVTNSSISENSFVFDGSTTYGTLPNSGFFSTSNNLQASASYAWSVAAWFKFPITPTTTRTGNASYSLCGQSGGIGGGETFTLFIGSGTDTTYGSYAPYYCAVGIFGTKTIISPSSVNTNTWNNVVVTWNGTTGRVYFNGIDRGALNVGTASPQTSYVFGIGQTGVTGHGISSVQLFEGSIANYLVYNRSLLADEINHNFNASRGKFGL